jgi:hypothetical protein
MSDTVLFIVTEPDSTERLNTLMPTFKPAGNIKDEAKKTADVDEKRKAFLENAHLSPLTGRIAGYGWMQDAEVRGCSYAADGVTEEKVIEKICKLALKNKDSESKFITYDGYGVEFPFLCSRASLYPDLHVYMPILIDLMAPDSLMSTSLNRIVSKFGLSFWSPSNPFQHRNVLTLKELAAFYEVAYTLRIDFHNAIADYRKNAGPKEEPSFDNPSGETMTENQKIIHGIMVKYLNDTTKTIYDIYQKVSLT